MGDSTYRHVSETDLTKGKQLRGSKQKAQPLLFPKTGRKPLTTAAQTGCSQGLNWERETLLHSASQARSYAIKLTLKSTARRSGCMTETRELYGRRGGGEDVVDPMLA